MARFRHLPQILFLCAFSLVIYNEWLVYLIKARKWVSLPNIQPPTQGVRLLFVADPQLIGHVYEHWAVGPFARWDSDRYMQLTFSLAIHHVQPEVIIFLGDLFDEGSIATDYYYRVYKDRFHNVFPIPDYAKVVYIPGDNDIGGEGYDRVTPNKTKRFDYVFRDSINGHYRFLEFLKVNYFTQSVQTVSTDSKSEDIKIRVALSHGPLLPAPAPFVGKALDAVKPDLVISAHEHLSRHIIGDKQKARYQHQERLLEDTKLWYFPTAGPHLHEIMVPTCSYRMGVPRMGYGAAVIEKSGEVHYTVLWLPARFPHLYSYIAFLVMLVLLFLSQCCKTFLRSVCR